MKSVLISIQPYWFFLIIAKSMGWNVHKEKRVEVRKNFPKNKNWSKIAKIYCTKNKKSFAKIPKEYQPFMEKFLGKVVGEFVCDAIIEWHEDARPPVPLIKTCLSYSQIRRYWGHKEKIFLWHISNPKLYDKPKELSEFYRKCEKMACEGCEHLKYQGVNSDEYDYDCEFLGGRIPITRPPQSWCYVEEVGEV